MLYDILIENIYRLPLGVLGHCLSVSSVLSAIVAKNGANASVLWFLFESRDALALAKGSFLEGLELTESESSWVDSPM
jgi:hypothetical protein